jgi:hypothetical protein
MIYKENINFTPHNLNSTTVTIGNDHTLIGLHTLEVERDEDECEVVASDDGIAIFSECPITSGKIKFQILEASASNDYLQTLMGTGFAISVSDVNAPNLACKAAQVRVVKQPVLKRERKAQYVEWTLTATYLVLKGSGYKLIEA